jgi:hypothetical protein
VNKERFIRIELICAFAKELELARNLGLKPSKKIIIHSLNSTEWKKTAQDAILTIKDHFTTYPMHELVAFDHIRVEDTDCITELGVRYTPLIDKLQDIKPFDLQVYTSISLDNR